MPMRGALQRLIKMAGSSGALEMLDRFLEESPNHLQGVRDCLGAGDLKGARHHFHRIRGDAGWLGAKSVQELAGQGEVAIDEGELDKVEDLLQELSSRCYESSQQLHRERVWLTGSGES